MIRSRRRVRPVLGVTLAVGALVLAACGSSSTPPSSAPSAAAVAFNAATTGVVNPSTKTGGTLKLAATGDCDSWDPARTYYAWCWDMQRLFTRTLMGYAPKTGSAGSTLVPDLATAAGTVSNGGKTWTYHLKSGLKFSTGQAITTADIKYGVERIFATDIISGGPTYLLCMLSKCDASGKPAYAGPYKDKNGLSSIQTPDSTTIVFNLQKPFADFNYLMALPDSAPVPQSADTGAKYQDKPVASGPFMISSYSPNKSTTFVRNPNWQQSTDTIRHPLVNEVDLSIITNADDLNNRQKVGTIDTEADGGVQSAFQSQIISNPNLKKNADNPLTGFTRYLTIAQTFAPLNNVHCRRAIFYAINKSDLLLARGGSYGGQIANTMTGPNILGAPKNSVDPYPIGANNTGDLTKAKQELAACGQPNGFTVNEAYVNVGRGTTVFNATQQALARVGIKVVSAPASQSTYYSTYIGSPANVISKKLGIMQAGWAADFPTAYGFWYAIADGQAIQQTGNSNYPSLNDPVVNSLLTKATQETNPTAQQDIVKQIDAQVMKDAVYLPFVFDKTLYYRNPRLTNVYIQGALGYYDYVNIGVTK